MLTYTTAWDQFWGDDKTLKYGIIPIKLEGSSKRAGYNTQYNSSVLPARFYVVKQGEHAGRLPKIFGASMLI